MSQFFVVSDKFQTRFFVGDRDCVYMFDPKTLADKKLVCVWWIQTNFQEQSLVRPIMDQNIHFVGRFKMAAAVTAGEKVAFQ